MPCCHPCSRYHRRRVRVWTWRRIPCSSSCLVEAPALGPMRQPLQASKCLRQRQAFPHPKSRLQSLRWRSRCHRRVWGTTWNQHWKSSASSSSQASSRWLPHGKLAGMRSSYESSGGHVQARLVACCWQTPLQGRGLRTRRQCTPTPDVGAPAYLRGSGCCKQDNLLKGQGVVYSLALSVTARPLSTCRQSARRPRSQAPSPRRSAL